MDSVQEGQHESTEYFQHHVELKHTSHCARLTPRVDVMVTVEAYESPDGGANEYTNMEWLWGFRASLTNKGLEKYKVAGRVMVHRNVKRLGKPSIWIK